jgi:hypothetical protein
MPTGKKQDSGQLFKNLQPDGTPHPAAVGFARRILPSKRKNPAQGAGLIAIVP